MVVLDPLRVRKALRAREQKKVAASYVAVAWRFGEEPRDQNMLAPIHLLLLHGSNLFLYG